MFISALRMRVRLTSHAVRLVRAPGPLRCPLPLLAPGSPRHQGLRVRARALRLAISEIVCCQI